MSARVSITVTGRTIAVITELQLDAAGRAAMNKLLAERLREELVTHFLQRDREPNKMDAPKSHFWADVAESTGVASVDADGAVVSVADERFRIHFYGGTIKPKTAKALTIPLTRESRGLFARDYERTFGRKLFTLPGVPLLFERTDRGNQSTVRDQKVGTRTRGQNKTLKLRAKSRIRPVYALKESVTIDKDPRAVPTDAELTAALMEEAEDFLTRRARQS